MTDWEVCLDQYEQTLEALKSEGRWVEFYEVRTELAALLAVYRQSS